MLAHQLVNTNSRLYVKTSIGWATKLKVDFQASLKIGTRLEF